MRLSAIASLALSGVLLAAWPEGGAAQGAGAECVQEENGGYSKAAQCWEGGKRRGRWVVRLPGGEVREGAYVAGKKQGRWVIRLPDGAVQEGPYVDGEKQGRWVLRHADGTVEAGAVAGGVRVGRWEAHRPDGSRRTFEMAGGRLVEGSVRVVARAQGGTRGAGAMTREERRRVQSALAAQGFDPGPADGVFGARTRRAIQAWQASRGHAATGSLTGAQVGMLHAPPRRAQATAQGGGAELLRLLSLPGWSSERESKIRALLRQGTNPNAPDGNGDTAVHYAAAGPLAYLRAVLAHGGRCGTKNRSGATPLHVAAAQSAQIGGPSPESVRMLIECAPGALAAKDHRGNTPLHAVYAGADSRLSSPFSGDRDSDILKTLLDAGANPNAGNRDGDTPMILLLKEQGVVFTHPSQLRLLLKAGASANTRDGKGVPALSVAILEQADDDMGIVVPLVRALLAAGANPDQPDRRGDTPLLHVLALEWEEPELAGALLKAGADPDQADRRGDTPLIHVAQSGYASYLDALLAAGADPCIPDRGGRLPSEYAAKGSYTRSVLHRAGGFRDPVVEGGCGAGKPAGAGEEATLALGRDERRRIQSCLKAQGHDPGATDGAFGPRTRAAIRGWQAARGAQATGYLTRAHADTLRSSACQVAPEGGGNRGIKFVGDSSDVVCTDPGDSSAEYTWSGQCEGGIPIGRGTISNAEGFEASGGFVDGKSEGRFVMRWPDGDVGEGLFADGKRTGNWVIRTAEGGVDEGPYVDGDRNGDWTLRFASGQVESGPYVDDKRNGDWILRFANGQVGKGPFVDGKLDGRWFYTDPDGSKFDKCYRAGEEVDDSICSDAAAAEVASSCPASTVVRSPKCTELWIDGKGWINEDGQADLGGVRIPCWQEVDEQPGCYVLRHPSMIPYYGGYGNNDRTQEADKVHLSGECCSGTLIIESPAWRFGFSDTYKLVHESTVVDGVPQGDSVYKVEMPNNILHLHEGPVVDGQRHGRWILRNITGGGCGIYEYRSGERIQIYWDPDNTYGC